MSQTCLRQRPIVKEDIPRAVIGKDEAIALVRREKLDGAREERHAVRNKKSKRWVGEDPRSAHDIVQGITWTRCEESGGPVDNFASAVVGEAHEMEIEER